MEQGPSGLMRKNTEVNNQNAGLHQNEIENTGVQENTEVQENMNAPQNDQKDPKNHPIIRIENMTDATEEDENEELEEAYMVSEGHEQQDNENEDTRRDNDTCEHNTDDETEDDNNEISSIMGKQYGTQNRENMQARKENFDFPQRCAYTQK